MITLYDNAFSPFARKVRMVLEHKRLPFAAIDGLAAAGHAKLAAVNPRVEVPVLVDGDLTIVNSPQIVAYLEHRYPDRLVYPADPATRAAALAWERIADTLFDAITHDVSNGGFGFPAGTRPDRTPRGRPRGLGTDLRRPRADARRPRFPLRRAFHRGARALSAPHRDPLPRHRVRRRDPSAPPRLVQTPPPARRLPRRRRAHQAFLRGIGPNLQRPARIVWRGDRIEWLLARGFHAWFVGEIEAGRVAWPRR